MKKTISVFIVVLMLLSLAACAAGQSASVDPTPTPAVPAQNAGENSRKVTPGPTSEPTPESSPEETEAPAPSNKWFRDEAWKLMEVICGLYGVSFDKDSCEIRSSAASGVKSLRWYSEELGAEAIVGFSRNDAGEWVTGMNHCSLVFEPQLDIVVSDKYQSDFIEIAEISLVVTVSELENAGFCPDGGEGDIDMAAGYLGAHIASLFTDCAEDSYFKCSDAAVVNVEKSAEDNASHTVRLALMPVDYSRWGSAYGDILGKLCDETDHFGYITISFYVLAERNEDGSFTASVNFLL